MAVERDDKSPTDIPSFSPVWWVVSSERAVLAPGIRYGEVPAGATEATPPAALVPDSSYFAYVGHQSRPPGNITSISVLGSARFTR